MKIPFLLLLLAAVTAMPACAHYRPLPLDEIAVAKSLTPPSADELRVRAAALSHPLLPPIALDESNGLSPDEAGVVAVLVNPTLRAERDRRALADAQVIEAGILPNPTLDASLDVPSFGATSETTSGWSYGLSEDLKSLVTRSARQKAARAGRQSVDLDVAWAEWQVAGAAKTAVYRVIGTEARVRLAEGVEKDLKGNLGVVEKAVKAGQLTDLDLAAARTAASEATANRLALERQTRAARLDLNRALGLPPGKRVKLEDTTVLPEKLVPPPESKLMAGLEDRRLDLVALRRGYASQEATVRAAILAQFPAVNLGVNRASDTSRVGTTGLGLSIELPIFDRNQAAIARERATRKVLFDEYVARVFATRADLASLRNAATSLTEEIAAAKAAEPGLMSLVKTYRTAVDRGQADVLSYYTAVSDLARKRIDVLALRQELAETRVALELASGLYRLDSLPAPSKMPAKEKK